MSLASRMAVRGVGEVSKALKPGKDPRGDDGDTGLYHQRHLHPVFGTIVPQIEFHEFQQPRRFISSVLKNLAIPAAERSFVQGCQAVLRGNLREARASLEEAYTRDTQFTDAYYLHGGISLMLEDYDEAVHTLKKVLLTQSKLASKLRKYIPSFRHSLCLTENSTFAIYPDLLGTNILLSLALRGHGDDADAANVLDQLLGVMPDHPVVHFFLACHFVEAGRWHDAADLLKDTLPEDNISLANLVLLGRALVATNDSATAIEIFKKILTRTDFDPQLMVDARYSLGKALARSGRPSEAEAEFNRITSMYPGYMDIFERLGLEPESRKKRPIPTVRPPALEPVEEAPPPPPPEAEEADYQMVSAEFEPLQPATSGAMHLSSADGRIQLDLTTDAVTIGREEGNIVLDWDSAASHLHARIVPESGGWWVEDLGSTNGTFVNGHRLGGRVLLNRGDVLTIGQTQLRLQ